MTIRRQGDKQLKSMTDLTTHLRKCYACKAALKSNGDNDLCRDGLFLCLNAAKGFSALARLHSAAFKREGQLIYACPDTGKHGKGYQMTATPMMGTAFQPELF